MELAWNYETIKCLFWTKQMIRYKVDNESQDFHQLEQQIINMERGKARMNPAVKRLELKVLLWTNM